MQLTMLAITVTQLCKLPQLLRHARRNARAGLYGVIKRKKRSNLKQDFMNFKTEILILISEFDWRLTRYVTEQLAHFQTKHLSERFHEDDLKSVRRKSRKQEENMLTFETKIPKV